MGEHNKQEGDREARITEGYGNKDQQGGMLEGKTILGYRETEKNRKQGQGRVNKAKTRKE